MSCFALKGNENMFALRPCSFSRTLSQIGPSLTQQDYADAHGPKQVVFATPDAPARNQDCAQILVGDRFCFRLHANPTVKRKVPGKKNGRRDPCVTEEQQLVWLARKGESGGFVIPSLCTDDGREVPAMTVTPLGQTQAYRKKDSRTLSHFGVRFEGLLVVTDVHKFTETIESGIGSGKAFGFGLLSIAKT